MKTLATPPARNQGLDSLPDGPPADAVHANLHSVHWLGRGTPCGAGEWCQVPSLKAGKEVVTHSGLFILHACWVLTSAESETVCDCKQPTI